LALSALPGAIAIRRVCRLVCWFVCSFVRLLTSGQRLHWLTGSWQVSGGQMGDSHVGVQSILQWHMLQAPGRGVRPLIACSSCAVKFLL